MAIYLYTYQGKALTKAGTLQYYCASIGEIIPQYDYNLEFYLSVIRNKEMDNIVGDAGSTNLHVSAINGNTLTVPNLPSYSKFYETNTWIVKNTSVNGTAVLCTSINDVAKTVTLSSASGFSVGTRIALLNPYLNWEFSGNQSSSSSIPANGSISWMTSETGGGTILPPKNGIKRWLFFGNNGTVNSMGLATSSDWQTWDVSNNQKPVLMASEVPGSPTSIYAAGSYVMVDNSICCMLGTNNGARIMCFDNDVSHFSFSDIIPATGVSAPGSLAKIGNYYHILIMDTSSGVAQRQIQALKSTNVSGPFTKYQDIIYGAQAPYGTAWDYICDMPVIINDGVNIMGIFGGQQLTGSLGSGVGAGNREGVILNFDPSTETWSININGPAFINPVDWPGAPWYYDHVGAAISTYIDGSIMYMGATFKGYAATMLKMKNFGDLVPSLLTYPTFKEYASGGSAQIFRVFSNIPWDVSSNPAWITISNKTWQRGDGKFTATASSNSGSARSGKVVLKCTSSPNPYPSGFSIDVSQFAVVDSVDTDWDILTFDGTGAPLDADYFTVTSSGTWTTSKIDTGDGTSWLTKLLPSTGGNGDTCSPLVQSGYEGLGRSCDVRFTVGTATKDVTVTQLGVI